MEYACSLLENNDLSDIADGYFGPVNASLLTLLLSGNALTRVPFAVSELPALTNLFVNTWS